MVTVSLRGHSPALVGSGGLLKSACALLWALPAHTCGSKGSCWLCSATAWLLLPGGRPVRGVWKQVDPGSNPGWVTRLGAQCHRSRLVSVPACERGWHRPSGPSGVGWAAKHCAAWTPPSGRGPLLGAPALAPLAPKPCSAAGAGGGLEAAGSGCATYSANCRTEALCVQGTYSWQPGPQTPPRQTARCGLSRRPGGPLPA